MSTEKQRRPAFAALVLALSLALAACGGNQEQKDSAEGDSQAQAKEAQAAGGIAAKVSALIRPFLTFWHAVVIYTAVKPLGQLDKAASDALDGRAGDSGNRN